MPRSQPADRGVAYFAAFLDLLHKKVVVVGGGRVASTKVRSLLPCQPEPLVVVAPHASAAIQQAARAGQLVWHPRTYAPEDLEGASLAFGASDDRQLNARVAADARRLGIPVLAVDDVPNCDFIAPAIVRRGELTVAISTAGRSPAMARRTRELLEAALPPFWGDLLTVAAAARERLGGTRSVIEPDRWQSALQGEVEYLASVGELQAATELLVRKLERSLFESDRTARGLVSLVGAGPGAADLLTLRAVERLGAADIVVHDRLVSEAVLERAAPSAERIDVGKSPGGRGATQADINTLLIDLARAGRRVVRLKGGDPFVFGRGGEEVLALAQAGIPFEVVPGISSALAAPAAAGIPVTHRGLSASVTVVNGHDVEQHDWHALARAGGTLVFLMAVEHLEPIVERLLAHGRAVNEPAALIESATLPSQRVLAAPLAEIAAQARLVEVAPPAVLVVGPTAALVDELGSSGSRAESVPELVAR
jgi:uroporphyrin-III C-methyltransferase / precorrin-2 dehydrogenase / sirohydrochlorin ferrochelatase